MPPKCIKAANTVMESNQAVFITSIAMTSGLICFAGIASWAYSTTMPKVSLYPEFNDNLAQP